MKKKEYENYTKHLDKTFIQSKNIFSTYENYFRKNILRFLPKNRKAKIIDLGCGKGHFLYFLEKNGYSNYKGIDIVKENVNYCIKKNLKVLQADLTKYVKKNKKIDVFILNNVLEHFSHNEIIKILNNCHHSLNPNGLIIIIVPNCNNIYGISTYFSDITHKSPLTEKSFEDLIQKTKFKKYSFHNLIIYPNIFLADYIFYFFNRIIFTKRRIGNLINGQKPYNVQSKNLLGVLKK